LWNNNTQLTPVFTPFLHMFKNTKTNYQGVNYFYKGNACQKVVAFFDKDTNMLRIPFLTSSP
jgi:hypothetical protein